MTAQTKRRLRCRMASQHAGCEQPSVDARALEDRFSAWLADAVTLPATERTKLAALVRAKVRHGADVIKADKVRSAIKRLTDAFTCGGIVEADYREQLRALQSQLDLSRRAPDERRTMEAIRVAQDLPRLWRLAKPERRTQLVYRCSSASGSPKAE